MQWDRHIPGVTEHYSAIEVRQPLADQLARGLIDRVILRGDSKYRGSVLIVSAPGKMRYEQREGMIVGRGELVSVEKVSGGYEYRLGKCEEMIEFPCQKCGAKGSVWDCYYTANTLMEKIKL